MNFVLKTSLALALLAGTSNLASAAVITYHQEADDLRSALSQIQFEDFEDATLLDGLSISGIGNIASGKLYRQVLPARAAVFSFAESTFGFGGMIRASSFGALAFTLTFDDGSMQTLDAFQLHPLNKTYVGFSSDIGIRAISVKPTGAAGVQFYLDDLTYGMALAAVPEPASWMMMIMGLGVVGSTMRRQRVARVSFP